MLAEMTVTLFVDVPDGTNLADLYLVIPRDGVTIKRMWDDQPVPSSGVQGYETVSVTQGESQPC
jgi:hypothetical protein